MDSRTVSMMLYEYSSDIVVVFFTAIFHLSALCDSLSCLLGMVIIYGTVVLSPWRFFSD